MDIAAASGITAERARQVCIEMGFKQPDSGRDS